MPDPAPPVPEKVRARGAADVFAPKQGLPCAGIHKSLSRSFSRTVEPVDAAAAPSRMTSSTGPETKPAVLAATGLGVPDGASRNAGNYFMGLTLSDEFINRCPPDCGGTFQFILLVIWLPLKWCFGQSDFVSAIPNRDTVV